MPATMGCPHGLADGLPCALDASALETPASRLLIMCDHEMTRYFSEFNSTLNKETKLMDGDRSHIHVHLLGAFCLGNLTCGWRSLCENLLNSKYIYDFCTCLLLCHTLKKRKEKSL